MVGYFIFIDTTVYWILRTLIHWKSQHMEKSELMINSWGITCSILVVVPYWGCWSIKLLNAFYYLVVWSFPDSAYSGNLVYRAVFLYGGQEDIQEPRTGLLAFNFAFDVVFTLYLLDWSILQQLQGIPSPGSAAAILGWLGLIINHCISSFSYSSTTM